MNIMHSTNRLLKYRNDKLTNMTEPNKLDHRCLLKQRNTRSNYLVDNIKQITDKYKLNKFQGFTRNPRISQYLE